MKWLMLQKLEHREQRIVLEELLEAVRQESESVSERLEQAIRDAVPEWSLAEVVTALQAMRGIDLVAAVTVLAEIGDLSRFQTPHELMRLLRPRTLQKIHCRAARVNRGGITKAGNGRGAAYPWSKPLGAIGILHVLAVRSRTKWRPHRERCARSLGKRK